MEIRNTDQTRMSAMDEFEALPEGTRAELIDGKIISMASPSEAHGLAGVELITQLRNYLRGKKCVVLYEHDVQLNADEHTVYRPDIIVVCDPSKRSPNRVTGTPDLIIEITSPSTAGIDWVTKFNAYLRAGVREYWIVDPDSQSVLASVLWGERYVTAAYGAADRAPVAVLEGCEIDLSLVFPTPEQVPEQV